jgi:hypothetical protein
MTTILRDPRREQETMINWSEFEELVRLRASELRTWPGPVEQAHIDLFTADASRRRPFRARVASVLVRLGTRLDPEAQLAVQSAKDEAVARAAIAGL